MPAPSHVLFMGIALRLGRKGGAALHVADGGESVPGNNLESLGHRSQFSLTFGVWTDGASDGSAVAASPLES